MWYARQTTGGLDSFEPAGHDTTVAAASRRRRLILTWCGPAVLAPKALTGIVVATAEASARARAEAARVYCLERDSKRERHLRLYPSHKVGAGEAVSLDAGDMWHLRHDWMQYAVSAEHAELRSMHARANQK